MELTWSKKLEDKIIKRVGLAGSCWIWTGKLYDGYGYASWEGSTWLAHRWTYTALVGPIPEGLDLDHICRVRHCVNPDHLEPVTRSENLRRSRIVGKGNPWSPESAERRITVSGGLSEDERAKDFFSRAEAKNAGLPAKQCKHGHTLTPRTLKVSYRGNGKFQTNCWVCQNESLNRHRIERGLEPLKPKAMGAPRTIAPYDYWGIEAPSADIIEFPRRLETLAA